VILRAQSLTHHLGHRAQHRSVELPAISHPDEADGEVGKIRLLLQDRLDMRAEKGAARQSAVHFTAGNLGQRRIPHQNLVKIAQIARRWHRAAKGLRQPGPAFDVPFQDRQQPVHGRTILR